VIGLRRSTAQHSTARYSEIMSLRSGADSVAAGLLGAAASVIGKVSLSPDSPLAVIADEMCSASGLSFCSRASLLARALGLGLMVYANVLMAFYLLRALDKSESVTVTVISSASNLLFSGILGLVVLGESVGFHWVVGSMFISTGVLLVLSCQQP
jgi:drug/metabolite transporter (DMT)-like permease